MPDGPLRAVIDTNVWISGLLTRSGPPARVREAFQAGRFTLVTSAPLLDELAAVLHRPRLRDHYGVTPRDAAEYVALLRQRAVLVPVDGNLRLCRDPDDDLLVETAIAGRAQALVTGDGDLLRDAQVRDVLRRHGVTCCPPAAFLDCLTGGP